MKQERVSLEGSSETNRQARVSQGKYRVQEGGGEGGAGQIQQPEGVRPIKHLLSTTLVKVLVYLHCTYTHLFRRCQNSLQVKRPTQSNNAPTLRRFHTCTLPPDAIPCHPMLMLPLTDNARCRLTSLTASALAAPSRWGAPSDAVPIWRHQDQEGAATLAVALSRSTIRTCRCSCRLKMK